MLQATRPHPARRSLYAGLGVAVLGTAALIATTAVLNSATDAVLGVASNTARVDDPAADITSAPLLADLQVPPAPAGCSPTVLDERATQIALVQSEQAAELQAINTITDASLADKLGAIRSRADVAVGRIQQIDSTC